AASSSESEYQLRSRTVVCGSCGQPADKSIQEEVHSMCEMEKGSVLSGGSSLQVSGSRTLRTGGGGGGHSVLTRSYLIDNSSSGSQVTSPRSVTWHQDTVGTSDLEWVVTERRETERTGSLDNALWTRAQPWLRAEWSPSCPALLEAPGLPTPSGGQRGGGEGEGEGERGPRPRQTPGSRAKAAKIRRSPRVTKGVPPKRYGQPSTRRTRGGASPSGGQK
ncbi:uncharacterized protein LOC125482712, partial [Rhincodon typus]|uniref:uncharacterized protein LOC125482712 n=1 Tax=Rhincodon typus TaxID=259920 RepID=UPI00202EB4AC